MTYIALLRAINVGGHNVAMEKLRGHFSDLGFQNVRSYIQTGNIFFDADADSKTLAPLIEAHLEKELGYKVPTFIRSIEQYRASLKAAPFKGEPTEETRFMVFSTERPVSGSFPLATKLGDYEVLGATETEAFVKVTLLKGKMSNSNALEKLIGMSGTARFFHTAKKILEAAQG